jgi:plasmid stabilization system protein ParE
LLSTKPARVREGSVLASASDDVLRQFRYYLVAANLPEVAVRFRNAVRRTVQSLRLHPLLGPRYSSSNRNFKICARDRLRDLKPFKFIIL